jgi:hypothetical protein
MKATSLPHHRRILLTIVSLTALLVVSTPAFAQNTASTSVQGALQAHFAEDSKAVDAAALREGGYAFERMLVAEMLPSEATLFAEVEIARGETRLRYPLKLKRRLDGDQLVWKVSWAPVEAYARGLVEIAGEDALASIGDEGTSWAGIERLPAFPVIVDEAAFVTPYGRVDAPEPSEVLKEIGAHAQRWVGLTLEDEPGTANVDLVLGQKASWARATQALMAPASEGLFRTYLVGRTGGKVVAMATAAPVVRQTADGASPLVVGMYREGDQHAFRMRIGDDVVENSDACGDKMAFCTASDDSGLNDSGSLDAFEQQALDHVTEALKQRQTSLAYVMFAATGEFGAGEVARHLAARGRALGVPSSKIFVGYIRGEQ